MVESDEDEVKSIALLHDIVEDCKVWTIERIRRVFNERIAMGVLHLTHGIEGYNYYIELLKNNPDAVLVKLADLRHNMDITRLPVLGEYEIKRLKKYHAAYLELNAHRLSLQCALRKVHYAGGFLEGIKKADNFRYRPLPYQLWPSPHRVVFLPSQT